MSETARTYLAALIMCMLMSGFVIKIMGGAFLGSVLILSALILFLPLLFVPNRR